MRAGRVGRSGGLVPSLGELLDVGGLNPLLRLLLQPDRLVAQSRGRLRAGPRLRLPTRPLGEPAEALLRLLACLLAGFAHTIVQLPPKPLDLARLGSRRLRALLGGDRPLLGLAQPRSQLPKLQLGLAGFRFGTLPALEGVFEGRVDPGRAPLGDGGLLGSILHPLGSRLSLLRSLASPSDRLARLRRQVLLHPSGALDCLTGGRAHALGRRLGGDGLLASFGLAGAESLDQLGRLGSKPLSCGTGLLDLGSDGSSSSSD